MNATVKPRARRASVGKAKVTREDWLNRAVDLLRVDFKRIGWPLPAKILVSCGWPSSGGLGRKQQTIGECWNFGKKASKHVFISPILHKAIEKTKKLTKQGKEVKGSLGVLVTLVHELCHAVAPKKARHGHKFQVIWSAVGMFGKPTGPDYANVDLAKRLETVAKTLGAYPHEKLTPQQREPKQGTRLLKLECGCGRIIRASGKVIEEGGSTAPGSGIECFVCGEEFMSEDDDA